MRTENSENDTGLTCIYILFKSHSDDDVSQKGLSVLNLLVLLHPNLLPFLIKEYTPRFLLPMVKSNIQLLMSLFLYRASSHFHKDDMFVSCTISLSRIKFYPNLRISYTKLCKIKKPCFQTKSKKILFEGSSLALRTLRQRWREILDRERIKEIDRDFN